MAWMWFVLLSFATGLLRLPRWTVVLWPAASLGMGIQAVAGEPAAYDMPGFGFVVGAFFAALCVGAWLLGRGLARLARRS